MHVASVVLLLRMMIYRSDLTEELFCDKIIGISRISLLLQRGRVGAPSLLYTGGVGVGANSMLCRRDGKICDPGKAAKKKAP